MNRWTALEAGDLSPRAYRHVDGWHLDYDQHATHSGWVVSSGDNLIPWEEVRNRELGPDEYAEAFEWANRVIDQGQEWANKAIVADDEAASARIM
jgi:hypothetical protein